MSFFPTFVDLKQLTPYDTIRIYVIATLAVGGVMMLYAVAANNAGKKFKPSSSYQQLMLRLSATLLFGSGIFLLTRNG